MTTDALENLHTAMLDTRAGYEVAERDADPGKLKTLFGQMIALRGKDHEAIHAALERLGVQPDDGTSLQATVHKVATSARAAITGLDENALSPFISGEDKILEKYDAAIGEAGSDTATRDMLAEQRATLSAKIAEMRAMKPA